MLPALLSLLLSATQPAPDAADDFSAFRESFRDEAIAAGVSGATYDREMATAEPVPLVLERNNNQPEFSRPIWSYLETAVSDQRVQNGLTNRAAHAETLNAAEAAYGVDAEIITAIWGLESSYGAILGNFDIVSSLSTLAYQGRRQSFGRTQLIGVLKIIDNGYATRDELKGSWAGAMGQTQFIPTTYLTYAVDENGDGRRDLWRDHEDVFASTANYLDRSGFEAGKPWGFEVLLPESYDYALAHMGVRRTVGAWSSMGVAAAHGALDDRVDLNEQASIILPAGASGPAFMVFGNYRAILRYNNSTAYGLGIGLLSDAVAMRSQPLVRDWPRGDRPLSRAERRQLQQALADRGFNPGPVDGIIGSGTQRALRDWQRSQGLPADGYASANTLTLLTAE